MIIATQDSIVVRTADWHSDKKHLTQIRRLVFIEEQKVPENLEWDEFDQSAIHFLVTHKNQPVGCARLKADGQIGRMAILANIRNQGIGSKLLQFVLQQAVTENLNTVYLHAQLTAVSFYQKHGFKVSGEFFFEANIPHREMSRKVC